MENDLHVLLNELPRFSYPFNGRLNDIPNNGIYIQFEKDEKFNNLDRVVRVGTDRGENNLRKRLNEHYTIENKNRSIFRKHIGRAFLNKENNSYLELWDLDTTSRANKDKNLKLLDLEFEAKLEKQISDYIQSNFSFSVFQVETKAQRLFWEGKIISTLAYKTQPSEGWLGNYSPKEDIRKSGLWQIQGLNGPKLTKEEFKTLKSLIQTK